MRKLAFSEVIEAKALLDKGQSHLMTARQFEAGKSTMRDLQNRRSWAWTDSLDSDDQRLIYALLNEGVSCRDVAKKFDLTYRQVLAIQDSPS